MGGAEGAARDPAIPAFVEERRQARIAELRAEILERLPPKGPLVVEFGCGHGHWLNAYAEAHPGHYCLGLDLISLRVRKSLAKRDKRGLGNLHFLKAEAMEFLAAWPRERSIDAVFMLFPDPWPKKRHHKNRMIQPAFLDAVAERTASGGRFHFRTDDADYFAWTEEHFAAHPSWHIDPSLPWPWETPTLFQNFMESWSSLIATRSPHPEEKGDLGGDSGEQA